GNLRSYSELPVGDGYGDGYCRCVKYNWLVGIRAAICMVFRDTGGFVDIDSLYRDCDRIINTSFVCLSHYGQLLVCFRRHYMVSGGTISRRKFYYAKYRRRKGQSQPFGGHHFVVVRRNAIWTGGIDPCFAVGSVYQDSPKP